MKKKLTYLFIACTALVLCSCKEKINKDIEWPVWASRPLIENMQITPADGGNDVIAGKTVNFSAEIHDDFNELSSYTLTISYAGATAAEFSGKISGNSYDLSLDFVMPFAAKLSESLVPEITLMVDNIANGKSSKRVDNDHNVTVIRPAVPDMLFIVDDKGNQYTINKTEGFNYAIAEGTDLSGLGSSFVIASAVKGNEADYNGIVWGDMNGRISVITESGHSIKTPESEGYGFKALGFNTYTFEVDKLVNYTVIVNKEEMSSEEQSGVNYLISANKKLIRYCEVVFKGFEDAAGMIQKDRFEVLAVDRVKFTGHTRNWTFYYDIEDNWMILNYVNFNIADQVWVTGKNACFPLGNDDSDHVFNYLSSDGKDRYGTLASVKDEDGVFHCLLYLKDGFYLQLYSWVKWSTVISMTTDDNKYGDITDDGIYINQGSEFKPGVYMLDIELTKVADAGGDGAVASINLTPFNI